MALGDLLIMAHRHDFKDSQYLEEAMSLISQSPFQRFRAAEAWIYHVEN